MPLQTTLLPPAVVQKASNQSNDVEIVALTRSRKASDAVSKPLTDNTANRSISPNLVGAQIIFLRGDDISTTHRSRYYICVNATSEPNLEFGLKTRRASLKIAKYWRVSLGADLNVNAYPATYNDPSRLELHGFSGVFLSGRIANLPFKRKRAIVTANTSLGFESTEKNMVSPKLRLGFQLELK